MKALRGQGEARGCLPPGSPGKQPLLCLPDSLPGKVPSYPPGWRGWWRQRLRCPAVFQQSLQRIPSIPPTASIRKAIPSIPTGAHPLWRGLLGLVLCKLIPIAGMGCSPGEGCWSLG